MKEKISKLIKTIMEKEPDDYEDICGFVEERLNSFKNYFDSVYQMTVNTEFLARNREFGRISTEDYQYRVEQLDKQRRMAHDVAIGSCQQLNRLCDMYEIEKFCPDTKDRYEIADFIGNYVSAIYQDGQNKNKPHMLDYVIQKAMDNGDKYDNVIIEDFEL